MDPFFGWTAATLTAYLAGCDMFENDIPTSDGTGVPNQGVPEHESEVLSASTNAQSFEQDTHSIPSSPTLPGAFPVSPSRSPLKRRARHQYGSPKRQKLSAEAYHSGSSSSTGARMKRRENSNSSSSKDLEARTKAPLPKRAISVPSTPASHNETLSSSTEGTRLDIQAVSHSTPGPTSPSPLDAISGQGEPWPLVSDNAMDCRKRPAPAEFDEEVSMPHRKKYITGWMSEYIRLRARSWREMLRVMQEARWRPFRPQVIRYVAPAPPSSPLTASPYG